MLNLSFNIKVYRLLHPLMKNIFHPGICPSVSTRNGSTNTQVKLSKQRVLHKLLISVPLKPSRRVSVHQLCEAQMSVIISFNIWMLAIPCGVTATKCSSSYQGQIQCNKMLNRSNVFFCLIGKQKARRRACELKCDYIQYIMYQVGF